MREKQSYTLNARSVKSLLTGFLLLLLATFTGFSQDRVVTGTVSDATGMAMPGVNVVIKGTTIGAVTDANGRYSIKVPSAESILVFSFIGYQSSEVLVGDQTTVNVTLNEEVSQLDEVVVVGYGTMKKKLVTGATVHVSSADIANRPSLRVEQALQGLSAGVMVSAVSGQPGSDLKVRVRGIGTIGDASPLYVVDGVPVSDISFLDPSNIESIDILKDAASGAIYGVRAANGVVLITTKKGKSGTMTVAYDGYYGVQYLIKQIKLLNGDQYLDYMLDAYTNAKKTKIPFPTDGQGNYTQEFLETNTNWQDYLFREGAPIQSHTISFDGGNEVSMYSAGGTYFRQEGIAGAKDMSYFERISGRINSNHKVKEYLTFGENITISYKRSRGVGVGNIYSNTIRGFLNASPKFKALDTAYADGFGRSYNTDETNPYGNMIFNNNNISRNYNVVGDAYLVVEPLKGLKIKSDIGINLGQNEYNSYTPVYQLSTLDLNTRSTATQSMRRDFSYNWENTVSYSKVLGQHSIELMAGSTVNEYSAYWVGGSKQELVIDDFNHAIIDNAKFDSTRNVYGAKADDALLSYFGRINYNFNEEVPLTFTYRRDGSTRFGPANRWGNFFSASAGWIISQREFFKNSLGNVIDYCKIRVSWGQNGNDRIPAFAYLSLIDFNNKYYYFGDQEAQSVGAAPSMIENAKLRWESAEQWNLGADFRILKDFSLAFDWYDKRQKGWLIRKPVLLVVGVLSDSEYPIVNGGDVRNRGVELELGYTKSVGELQISVKANVAKNKNEVIDIPTEEGIIHGQSSVLYNGSEEFYRAQTGYPLGYFYGYKTNGIFQNADEIQSYVGVDSAGNTILGSNGKPVLIQPKAQPGDVRFVDLNKDGKIDEKDKTMIGNPYPDYTYGLNFNMAYKGFDFGFTLQGVYGNDIVYGVRVMDREYANWDSEMLNRWRGEGTSNRIPRAYAGIDPNLNWKRISDLYINDGSYMKVRNITVGYDFGRLIKGPIKQCRLYFTVANAFVFTSYKGLDPEVGYGATSTYESMSSGIDLGTYPQPRQYMLGLNLKF
ncbi:MAG TPA: TonB-dependent receptor [Bacteroidales bacterium]|nr:TonB-dependent receptor [Bacteroidales bacterium]